MRGFREGMDFPELPASPDVQAWEADLRVLDEAHRRLTNAVSALRDAELKEPAHGHRQSREQNLVGIALHDVYHAGQVRLLRAVYAQRQGVRR